MDAITPGVSAARAPFLRHLNVVPQRDLRGIENPAADEAQRVRDAFVSFVGETFFSQMIKAMRSSTGKPAYFHGGRAEEIFRGQLDQVLTEQLTDASASQFADPMFGNQFPHLAKILSERESANVHSRGLTDLSLLKRT